MTLEAVLSRAKYLIGANNFLANLRYMHGAYFDNPISLTFLTQMFH